MKRISFAFVLILGLVVCTQAQAGLMFVPTTYGLSAKSVGLGNAMTAVGGDYSTTFYNPAALSTFETNQVDLSYMYAQPNFTGGPKGEEEIDFDTANKLTLIGFTMDLSKLFAKRHGLGLGFDMIMDNNLRSFMEFSDTRDDNGQFVRYGLTSVTMVTGLGVKIIPQLSIGGGGFIMVKGKNKLIAKTDMGGNTSEEEIQVSAEPAIAPMVSAFAPVYEKLTIGAVYRGKGVAEFSSIDASTEAMVSESPLTNLNLLMAFKDAYVPQQVAVGVSGRPCSKMLVAVDATWANWGDYDDEVKEGDVVKEDSMFRTHDTYTPRIGFEYAAAEGLALRLGYFYEQSPFSKPGIGDTLVLDNDKHAISLGAGYDIKAKSLMAHPVSIGASYFYHKLVAREAESGDGRKFESSGDLQGIIGSLTLRF